MYLELELYEKSVFAPLNIKFKCLNECDLFGIQGLRNTS